MGNKPQDFDSHRKEKRQRGMQGAPEVSADTWRALREERAGVTLPADATPAPAWAKKVAAVRTPPAQPEKLEGAAFLNHCAKQVQGHSLCGYRDAWKRHLDSAVEQALRSEPLKEAASDPNFARIFPKTLTRAVARIAAQQSRSLGSQRTTHDFMLEGTADNPSLKPHINKEIKQFASDCIAEFYQLPAHRIHPAEARIRAHLADGRSYAGGVQELRDLKRQGVIRPARG